MPNDVHTEEIFNRLRDIEVSIARIETSLTALKEQADQRTQSMLRLEEELDAVKKANMKILGGCSVIAFVLGLLAPMVVNK